MFLKDNFYTTVFIPIFTVMNLSVPATSANEKYYNMVCARVLNIYEKTVQQNCENDHHEPRYRDIELEPPDTKVGVQ